MERNTIEIRGAHEHNLKHIDVSIPRQMITVVTGVSGSGKSSLAFDTILAEANRRFFYTLSHYSRQFLDLGARPALRSASGLSPAIALAQNETQASVRATVASLSDIGEMLGVLFARFAEKRCPTHDLPTEARSLDEIVSFTKSQYFGRTIAVTVTVADQKKGQFKKQLEGFVKKGYSKAFIDGKLTDIDPVPNLAKDEKHDIALIVDSLKVDPSKEQRLRRSIETSLALGEGLACIHSVDSKGKLESRSGQHLSLQSGCPVCHFAWPRLDTRHFSPNSLGRCEVCDGRGIIIDEEEDSKSDDHFEPESCKNCAGTGLDPKLKSVTFRGRSIQKFYTSTIKDLFEFASESIDSAASDSAAVKLVLETLLNHAQRMMDIGLGYLHLGRRIRTLSNGEAQRLRLSAILNEHLRGVLYVLDEPSQGLHPREIDRLWRAIERLKAQGNTVIIVDHDPDMMRRADWIIDLGPGGGVGGGMLLAQFAPKDAKSYAKVSATAEHLHSRMTAVRGAPVKHSFKEFVQIDKPRLNNLKMNKVRFPLGGLTVVSGVSGSGKSSLVLKTLYYNMHLEIASKVRNKPKAKITPWSCSDFKGAESVEFCTMISRKPIAKSSVSMPATYLDIFTDLRNLFASLPEAQIYGLSASSFSFSNDEGRCPECKGRGTLTLSMKFLADAEILCPLCQGKRYKPHLLDIRFGGLNLSEVLNLSIGEAYERFKNFRAIERKLAPAVALGLSYLKLGQPSSSLSGGESQRLKLVPYLSKRVQPGTVLLMDEPTVGLHFKDVQLLMDQLHKLVVQGVSMVVIEHDQQVIESADWLIELGPESGDEGGQLLYEGPPQNVPPELRTGA